MKPTMGRIIHVWDNSDDCWRAGMATSDTRGVGNWELFEATMFRPFDTVPGVICRIDYEDKQAHTGWRWPPREKP